MSVGEPKGPGQDPAEIIGAGARCVSCGYELRGLTPDGPCPECGTPASLSLRPPGVADADPAWLARQARGARIMMLCSMWAWLLPLVWALALMGWRREVWHVVAFLAIGLGLGLVMIAGVSRCCTPEPGRSRERGSGRPAALILAWGVPVVALVLIAATVARAPVLSPGHWSGWMPAWAAYVCFLGAALATMLVQRGVMLRLGAPRALASMAGVGVAAAFLALTLVPWILLAIASGAGRREPIDSLFTCVSACLVPPAVLLLIAAWLEFEDRCLRAIRLGRLGATEPRAPGPNGGR